MDQLPNPKTLLHLVPTNQYAVDALNHTDNKRFLSKSRKGPVGLEVGFHVPSMPSGRAITKLGRNADLILPANTPGQPMSTRHVAFEFNPASQLVILSVLSTRPSTVTFRQYNAGNAPEKPRDTGEPSDPQPAPDDDNTAQRITGAGVMLYGQDYIVSIASYDFVVFWIVQDADHLKRLALEGYQESTKRIAQMKSRDQPTIWDNTETQSWIMTKTHTASEPLVKEIPHHRKRLGGGAFGNVYKAVDQISGNPFAVKVINLAKYGTGGRNNIELARARVVREIEAMKRTEHKHIVEFLGCRGLDTNFPEILMPLRKGSISDLAKKNIWTTCHEELSNQILEQMLSALDYLASVGVIHRDLKPDNILYDTLPDNGGSFRFQLADFGLAREFELARTHCGTFYYQAPELHPHISKVNSDQSPKMDVWSLVLTIIAFEYRCAGFPLDTSDYGVLLERVAKLTRSTDLEPMARLNPVRRASAAQMLVRIFKGVGLTTPRSEVPDFEPMKDNDHRLNPLPIQESSNTWQRPNNNVEARRNPRAAAGDLVVIPRSTRRRLLPAPPGRAAVRKPPANEDRRFNLGVPNRLPRSQRPNRVNQRIGERLAAEERDAHRARQAAPRRLLTLGQNSLDDVPQIPGAYPTPP